MMEQMSSSTELGYAFAVEIELFLQTLSCGPPEERMINSIACVEARLHVFWEPEFLSGSSASFLAASMRL